MEGGPVVTGGVDPITRRLYARRVRLRKSQRWVAREIGTHQSQVSGWESGLIGPTLESVRAWATALGMSLVVVEDVPGEVGPWAPGWPDGHMLEAAAGLLANAVAFDPATGWDEAKRRWFEAYHRHLAALPTDGGCYALTSAGRGLECGVHGKACSFARQGQGAEGGLV